MKIYSNIWRGVWNQWNGMVEWNDGMEWWNGTQEWNSKMVLSAK